MPRKTAVIEEPELQETMEPEEAQDIVEDDELYEEEDIEEDDDFDEDDLDDLEDEEFDEEAEFAEEDELLDEGNEPDGETDHAEDDNIAEFPEMNEGELGDESILGVDSSEEGDQSDEVCVPRQALGSWDKVAEREKSYVQNMMKDLHDAAVMTQTNFWRNHFYPALKNVLDDSKVNILEAEKSRDIIRHQETIKIVTHLITLVEAVVTDFHVERDCSPLLANEFEGKEAEFDRNLGMIIVR